MSCKEIQPELVGFHFGVVSEETRAAVEEHLLRCPDCLRSYLAVKRDLETAESSPEPSAASRLKLRRAVAEELGLAPKPRRWSWWERPLAFTFAGAAVLVAMLMVGSIHARAGSMPHGLARPAAMSPR